MNSLLATPAFPPHFHEHSRLSPTRSMSTPTSSRKRKADDDSNGDQDERMSASPSSSPAFSARPLPPQRQIKRARPNLSGRALSLPRLLETLDTDSLRNVLRTLCDRHPTLSSEVVQLSPRPSVASALQVLHNYQTSLQNSFPLGGNAGSDYAYNRVRQALNNLLDALNDFTPHFLPPNESQSSTSLSYLDGATSIIHNLPRWDTPQNNLEKQAAYEEMSKAWSTVIREASKRGGGIQLQYGGWDEKLAKHNEISGGKLQEAVNDLKAGLGWMGGHSSQHGQTPYNTGGDTSSIRQQLLSGTYGVPMRTGVW